MPSPRRRDMLAKSPVLRRLKRNIHRMKHALDDLVAESRRKDSRRKRSRRRKSH
ncbi:MAG: hypothetical protein HYY93_13050 [Planctomycetes bacterium]|nr:hypothetical protein [Planctomycetota bacterium]